MNKYFKYSKFLSLLLRHRPDIVNLKVDDNGWCYVNELISKTQNHELKFNIEILEHIVKTDLKSRYSFDLKKEKIRANQGHSININNIFKNKKPPNLLYHGTNKWVINKILKDGIKKMGRQFVHLTDDYNSAVLVGKRRGDYIIIHIDSKAMYDDKIQFYLSENNVWLVDKVLTQYISEIN